MCDMNQNLIRTLLFVWFVVLVLIDVVVVVADAVLDDEDVIPSSLLTLWVTAVAYMMRGTAM